MSQIENKRYRERARAAGIVRKYMMELQNRLSANPNARNAENTRRLILRLNDICYEIMGNMANVEAAPKRGQGNDFSLEEIEKAEELINSANTNPFD